MMNKMIDTYLNNSIVNSSVKILVFSVSLITIGHAVKIYSESDTFKEFLIDFAKRLALIVSVTIVGVIALIVFR